MLSRGGQRAWGGPAGGALPLPAPGPAPPSRTPRASPAAVTREPNSCALCLAVLCHAILCHAVLCCATPCHAVPFCAAVLCRVPCSSVPCCALCCAVPCCSVPCCALCCAGQRRGGGDRAHRVATGHFWGIRTEGTGQGTALPGAGESILPCLPVPPSPSAHPRLGGTHVSLGMGPPMTVPAVWGQQVAPIQDQSQRGDTMTASLLGWGRWGPLRGLEPLEQCPAGSGGQGRIHPSWVRGCGAMAVGAEARVGPRAPRVPGTSPGERGQRAGSAAFLPLARPIGLPAGMSRARPCRLIFPL